VNKPRVGIIGLGFMGRTHLASYRAAGANVVAALDPSGARSLNSGNLPPADVDLGGIEIYRDSDEFFSKATLDAVSVCTPTDSHVAVAKQALSRGWHVLVEKPVALQASAIRDLAQAAQLAGRWCIPAMVMRFWPGWTCLRDCILDNRHGLLRSLSIERLGSLPQWNKEFFADESRSGGAIADLHIHDTDFVYWCFGRPDSVVTSGTPLQLTTIYRVGGERGPLVSASGGWGQHPSFGFRMRYLANFERATIEFDLGKGVTISNDDGSRPLDCGLLNAYESQVAQFLRVIGGDEAPRATLEQAALVAEILDLERQSMISRGCGRWPREAHSQDLPTRS